MFRSKIEETRYRESRQKKHTSWIVFGSKTHQKKLQKQVNGQRGLRGSSGTHFWSIGDQCLKCFDVFWNCFPPILKKLRDVHFVVSIFIVCAFFVVCACAFRACVRVCRLVSCRVELCRVVSCRFLLFFLLFFTFSVRHLEQWTRLPSLSKHGGGIGAAAPLDNNTITYTLYYYTVYIYI